MLFVFPGQGSQKIGMGKDIYDAFQSARETFHEVNDAISFKLSDLIFNGTDEELKATENTQPALMTVSMVFTQVLKKEFGIDISEKAKFLAGHSLGEYSALCAAGVISISDAAKILRTRGLAMAKAYPSDGAMVAIIGLDKNLIEKITSQFNSKEEFAQIANDNSVGHTVVSGCKTAVKKVIERAIHAGAKKAILLDVSGPFHSDLMKNAIEPISEALQKVDFQHPVKPIISNVTAKAETNNLKELLIKQVTNRVRWVESIKFAESNAVSRCAEVGSGKVLTGLIKRISPNMELININSIESLETFAVKYR